MKRLIIAIVMVSSLAASSAWAGINDTPLPIIPPATKAAKFVFSIPWTITNGSLATVITCTSLATTTYKVAVQLFDSAGSLQNNVVFGDGALDVAPGQTVSFATQSVAGLPIDQIVTSAGNSGSARVVSLTTSLLCTAQAASRAGATPAVLNTLTIVKGKVQK